MNKKSKTVVSVLFSLLLMFSFCLGIIVPISNNNKENKYLENIFNANAVETGASEADESYKGGAIYIESGARYSMKGGSILGKSAMYGGAVYVSSGATFVMEGGTIKNCSAKYGGAIYVEKGGTCILDNCVITGNTAEFVSSIFVERGATLNIGETCKIYDNEYAVYVEISKDTIEVGRVGSGLYMHYLTFGSYPQTYVGAEMNTTLSNWYSSSSPEVVKTYEIRTRTWEAFRYTDGNIYARGLAIRATSSSVYRDGTAVQTGKIAWFKVEPIKWLVLNYSEYMSGKTEQLKLLAYNILCADIYFNETEDAGNSWETSNVRNWLNTKFYNTAFNSYEQKRMAINTIGNNVTGSYKDDMSLATEDLIYILSYQEVTSTYFKTNDERMAAGTDFALANYLNNGGTGCLTSEGYNRTAWIQLRSAALTATGAHYLRTKGNLTDGDSANLVTVFKRGLRPVIAITMKSRSR